MNRFHKVPAIKENDLLLSESVAIFHHLGRKEILPSRWYPKDLKKLAKIDEYLQWQHTNLFSGAGMLFYMQFVEPLRTGVRPSVEEVENQIRNLNKNLDDLENVWLKEYTFLTGNEISFADLMGVCQLQQVIALKLFQIDEKKHARVNKWHARVTCFFGDSFSYAHRIIYSYGEKVAVKN